MWSIMIMYYMMSGLANVKLLYVTCTEFIIEVSPSVMGGLGDNLANCKCVVRILCA